MAQRDSGQGGSKQRDDQDNPGQGQRGQGQQSQGQSQGQRQQGQGFGGSNPRGGSTSGSQGQKATKEDIQLGEEAGMLEDEEGLEGGTQRRNDPTRREGQTGEEV